MKDKIAVGRGTSKTTMFMDTAMLLAKIAGLKNSLGHATRSLQTHANMSERYFLYLLKAVKIIKDVYIHVENLKWTNYYEEIGAFLNDKEIKSLCKIENIKDLIAERERRSN